MSIETHMQALAEKRETLKLAIEDEKHHPLPDFMKIGALKKQNMKLKEEMMQLSIESKHPAKAG